MRRTSFGNMQCPIARSLERVGEWWSILILRDAFHGLRRFDEFQENLGIAPNMLARRLKALVEAGLLERRRYNDRPPRNEYLLTQAGRDFRPVLWALLAWGNKHGRPIRCWWTATAAALSSSRIFDRRQGPPPTHRPGVAMLFGRTAIVPSAKKSAEPGLESAIFVSGSTCILSGKIGRARGCKIPLPNRQIGVLVQPYTIDNKGEISPGFAFCGTFPLPRGKLQGFQRVAVRGSAPIFRCR